MAQQEQAILGVSDRLKGNSPKVSQKDQGRPRTIK